MKILVIGDLHGHDTWKEIINTNTFDKVVFIGDYLDSRTRSCEEQLSNFLDILKYKKDDLNDVILLIGNHELHYLDGIDSTYSGHNYGYSFSFNSVLENALKDNLLQMAYKDGQYLFTHAGVSETWCLDNGINYTTDYIADEINELFKHRRVAFDINRGGGYGNEIYQSPVWIRPGSLYNDSVDFMNVIGHTSGGRIKETDKYILTDALPNEYIIIDTKTNKTEIKKL